ncbi:MAG: type II secretion system protein [Pseudomonadota bacterium]
MSGKRTHGFTLIELLVVLAIVAMLLSIVAPRYIHKTEQAKETVLREQLASLRTAIDYHYGDHGEYPPSLQALVDGKYLRKIPVDPVTGRDDTWQVTMQELRGVRGVYDVHSGAAGNGRDGTPYAGW